MVANVLDILDPQFKATVQQLLANCQGRHITMQPYEGLRTPIDQAIYWRQSRTAAQAQQKIQELRAAGANFLAHCIESVNPPQRPHVTDAIPGLSWHQWGEAVDCFWEVNGGAEWSTSKLIGGLNGYSVYAEEAAKLGLTAGLLWPSFQDAPHVQLRSAASPLDVMTLVQIDQLMHDRFSDNPSF